MSIADKLTTIAENEQNVYDAGKQEGYNKGYTEGKEDGVTEGHTTGYNEGYQAYYDWFWNQFQYNNTNVNYTHRFYRWTNSNILNPKYDYKHSTSAAESGNYTFAYMQSISDLKKDNICSDVTNLSYTCYQSGALKNARTFHVTEKTKYSYAFSGCSSLEEIRFSGTIGQNGLSFSSCTKLSKASILGDEATEEQIATGKNIITLNGKSYYKGVFGALSDTTSGLKVTFSLVAVNKAFETSEGAADGSTSTEWTELVATKPNWTIALG